MAEYEFLSRISYNDIGKDMKLSLRGAMGLFQEAAIIHSDMTGYSIGNVNKTHVIWMLLQWRIRLWEPVSWNETVIVRTWPKSMAKVTSERDFEIISSDGRCVASATSNWALINADTGRLTRITPQMLEAYDLTQRNAFFDDFPEIEDAKASETFSCHVLRRDIDTNNHVNNRVYLDYALEALPQDVADFPFAEVLIRYKKQLLLGQNVRCLYRCTGQYYVVDICSDDGVHATVTLKR